MGPELLRMSRFRSFDELHDPRDRQEAMLGQSAAELVSRGLSTYATAGGDTLRLVAEHVVSFVSPGTKTGLFYRVPDCGGVTIAITAGGTLFEYSRQQHRDLVFEDEAAVEALAQRWLRSLPTVQQHGKSEVLGYVQERLAAEDAEWLAVRDRAHTLSGKPCKRWFR